MSFNGSKVTRSDHVMTTSDHLCMKRLLVMRLSIRGDVCGFKWRPEMFTFFPQRSPEPNFFKPGKPAPHPSGNVADSKTWIQPLKELTNAENHNVGVAGSGGQILR